MANVLAPFGFTPVRRQDGAAWTGNLSVRKIASANGTAIYLGDAVKSLNTGYITQAGANDTQIAGVFNGCKYLSTSRGYTVWSKYWPGSDATGDIEAYIIDDPGCVFLAQTGGASSAALGISAIGNNIKLTTATAGSTLTGMSGMAADDNNVAVTTTYPFRVVDIPGVQVANLGAAVNGYDTATKYNLVLVAFNAQDFKSLTGI